jgi:hypothetical protein
VVSLFDSTVSSTVCLKLTHNRPSKNLFDWIYLHPFSSPIFGWTSFIFTEV